MCFHGGTRKILIRISYLELLKIPKAFLADNATCDLDGDWRRWKDPSSVSETGTLIDNSWHSKNEFRHVLWCLACWVKKFHQMTFWNIFYFSQNIELIIVCPSQLSCSKLTKSVLATLCNKNFKQCTKAPDEREYSKCLKFWTLYSILFWRNFCFFCSCFLKYLGEWYTV